MPLAPYDLYHDNFNTHQNGDQPKPNSVVAAATIAPRTLITFVSGTTPAIATITPPLSGQHMLIVIHTDAPATYLTTGNILNAVVPTEDLPTFFFYDPVQQKYYGCASNLT